MSRAELKFAAVVLIALTALVVPGVSSADASVEYEYIDHERAGVAGYHTEMVLEITNTGSKTIDDEIVYDVSRYAGATHDRRNLTLQPGESRIVELETRLATTIQSFQLWDIKYNGTPYDPPEPTGGSPYYRINHTRVIDDITSDKGPGGNFTLDVAAPNSVNAGEPIHLDVTVDNVGNQSATQIVTAEGPTETETRAFTVGAGDSERLPLSVCSPINVSDSETYNVTVSTYNATVNTSVTVSNSSGGGLCDRTTLDPSPGSSSDPSGPPPLVAPPPGDTSVDSVVGISLFIFALVVYAIVLRGVR